LLVLSSKSTNGDDRCVGTGGEIVSSYVLVANVEESVAMSCESGSFSIQFEDDQSRIVTCGKTSSRKLTIQGSQDKAKNRRLTSSEQVESRMSGQNPEPIIFPPKRLYRRPLAHIPHPDSLVLRVRNDQLVFRMEQCRRNIVEMSSASIDFPRFRFRHPPQLDLSIITTRDDQR